MENRFYILILLLLFSNFNFAQQNAINIEATLNTDENNLMIQQEIVYSNNSNETLNHIFLHNWPHSFKDRKTPLSKRFIEDLAEATGKL